MSAGEDERRWLEGLDERTEYEREYEHRMSAGDRDTLALERLLAEHPATLERNRTDDHLWQCLCGQIMGQSDSPLEKRHRAHLVDVIASSDWLREQRSEAWLKGHLKGMHYTHPEICDDEICPNPYRTTEDTDAH